MRPKASILGGLLALAAFFGTAVIEPAQAQDRFASALENVGRPDAVRLTVPSDPCDALYRRLAASLASTELHFDKIALDTEAFFKHFCEEKKDELIAYVRAPFDEARAQAEAAVQRGESELTAGFWKFVAEQLYEVLPAEEQARFQPGSPQMQALAHKWLNDAPDEAATYAIAYLTAGGQQSRIVNAWKIYADLTNGESKQIFDGMQEVLDTAKRRLRQLTDASSAMDQADPETPTADILNSVGLSGEWVDRFKSYEGQLRAINKGYRITDAAEIVSSAMGSGDPTAKIQGFFKLIEISGQIASDSKLPLIALMGDIVQSYAEVANQMLDQVFALEDQIAKRNGFCLGVGVPSRDPRHDYFVGRQVLACPLAYGTWPFEHIYVSQGAGPARHFFYDGASFIEGENATGRNGIIAALELIDAAIDLGYPVERNPRDHVARLAAVYNTSHPGGVPGLIREAETMVGEIDTALSAIRNLSVSGDACTQDQIMADVAGRVGLSEESFLRDTEGGSERLVNAIAASFVAFEGGFGPSVNRGGGAFETYAELYERLGAISVMMLEGEVRDQNGMAVPGAILSVRVGGGSEVRGCEAWIADRNGRFSITAIGEDLPPAVTAQAQTPAGAGPAETFDVAYVRRNALTFSDFGSGFTGRAEIVLRLPAEPEDTDADDRETPDETAEEQQRREEEEQAAEIAAKCDALEDAIDDADRALRDGRLDGLTPLLDVLDGAEDEALAAGDCPPRLAGAVADIRSRVATVEHQRGVVANLLQACDQDAMRAQARQLQRVRGINFAPFVDEISAAQRHLSAFEDGRTAYKANRLDMAQDRLNKALQGFRAQTPPICPPFIARAEQGLSQIDTLREFGRRIDAAIAECNVDLLERMAASTSARNHLFFLEARQRIETALPGCRRQQDEQRVAAVCEAGSAELDAARADYRSNRLDAAGSKLNALAARLDRDAPGACTELRGRIANGLSNITLLREQAAALQSAIAACDIDRLEAMQQRAEGENHIWFRQASGRIADALAQCSKVARNVCDELPPISAEIGAAFQAGDFVAALAAARRAEALSRDIAAMEGCEGERPRIENAVSFLSDARDVLSRTDAAVAACTSDFNGLVRRIDGLAASHARLENAKARLLEAAERCAAEEAEDEAPEVALNRPETPAAQAQTSAEALDVDGAWRGNGAFELEANGDTLAIPYELRFTVSGGSVSGRMSVDGSTDTLPLNGGVEGSVIVMSGQMSQDGVTVRVRHRAELTSAGELDGVMAVRLPELQCLGEAIGAAIGAAIAETATLGLAPDDEADDNSLNCPMATYQSRWSGSRG